MRHAPWVMVGLLALGGCASTPDIHYYTFAMEPSGAAQPTVNVDVEGMRTTEALSRRRILIQAGPTEVQYYATDEWAGSLGELVAEKLRTELGPAREGRPTVVLSGTVLACEQVDTAGGADARARIRVFLRDPSLLRYQPPLLEKTYEAVRPAGRGDPKTVARALSACLEEIAAAIARDASEIAPEASRAEKQEGAISVVE